MQSKELQIIQELMEQLQSEMSLGKKDLASRLGRESELEEPKLEVLKVEASPLEEDLDLDMDEEDDEDDQMDIPYPSEEKLSPEDELKRRLLKLRE